jgi:hypothetical protein
MSIKRNHVEPGGFKSLSIKADGVDISSLLSKLNVFQDIFNPTWTARLEILDAENTQITQDIHIGSEVEIIIETETQEPCNGVASKSFNFIIYNISNKTLIKKGLYGYILELITKDAVKDSKTRISKSYKKVTPNELVNKILEDGGFGKAEVDNDPIKYDVIIPNWTPFTAVEWVCRFSKLPQFGADFTFFQKDENRYAFKSVENMFKEKSGYRFIHKESNFRENSIKEDSDSFIKIQSYSFISELDGLKNMVSGFFGNKSIAHDIINKKVETTEYVYSQDNPQDKQNKPWKGTEFEDAKDSVHSFSTLHSGMTSKTQSIHETHQKWKGSRKSHQIKLDTNRLLFNIPGSICIWDAIGKTVEIELPTQEDVTKEMFDKYFKGDYLVLAINHMITPTNYWISIEGGKKRLNTKITED